VAEEAERVLRGAIERLAQDPQGWARTEKAVRDGAHRIGATILGAALEALGNGYEGSILPCACGGGLKYVSDRERGVVSLVGTFRIRRSYYWCPTCQATRVPLDGTLAIGGTDFSPGVREAIARLGAQGPFAQGRELLGELTGLWISARTHRQVSEGIGGLLASRETSRPASETPIKTLYLLADGAMAPTREGWREVKVGVAFAGTSGPDGKPRRQETRYFADVLDAETFGWRWYHLAEAAGSPRAKRLVVLGDGAVWIWNLAAMHFPGAVQIVDWYHATEHLWLVANTLWGEGSPASGRWAGLARKHLAGGHVERVIALLRRLSPRPAEAKRVVRETIGYFQNNADRMRYRRFRRQGLFIGSGVVEAGCKHIVGQRLKGSGMRWSLEGLRAILALRLAVLYGPWPLHSHAA
jgi:hypothetical protein